jgi:FAD synthase
MAKQSARDRNKQLKKRLRGLENKVYQYGELGVDVALVIGFREKEGGYSYTTSEEFLQRISQIVGVLS